MARIGIDTATLRRGLAGLVVGAGMAVATHGAEPPQDVLGLSHVRDAASRAMVNLDRRMICWKGQTPKFDGRIEPSEYSDASGFRWNADWTEAMQQEIVSPRDLDFEGWIKHDGEHLYLALSVTDDTFYGIETERWLPGQDPNANVIGERERGRPWFGDMIEVLIYGRMLEIGRPVSDVTGDGRGVQIIYNLTKSHEGGVGVPGMLPHGPNRTVENWENNKRWILEDIIETKTEFYESEDRYSVELRIRLTGGIEIAEGKYWTDGDDDMPIGFNLAVGDVDTEDKSPDGLLHHETWWAGKMTPLNETPRAKLWGALVLTSQRKDGA